MSNPVVFHHTIRVPLKQYLQTLVWSAVLGVTLGAALIQICWSTQ